MSTTKPRRKKADPAQLELRLLFDAPLPPVVVSLIDALTGYAHPPAKAASGNQPSEDPVRVHCRRLVGVLASQSGRTFEEIWIRAYHELFRRTGYHAVVMSSRSGYGVFLDHVQDSGRMLDLQITLEEMILADARSSRPTIAHEV